MLTVLTVIVGVGVAAGMAWVLYHASDQHFQDAYDQAMMKDLAYSKAHPDCTLEEAHRERARVRRRYGRP